MKQFFCGDVVPGCTARFEAEDEAQILAQIASHAHNDHGLQEIPEALILQVRGQIRDLPIA